MLDLNEYVVQYVRIIFLQKVFRRVSNGAVRLAGDVDADTQIRIIVDGDRGGKSGER